MSKNIWPEYRDKLSGAWKCLSFEMLDESGKAVAKPHGDEPLGRLQISRTGFFSSHTAVPNKMKPLPSGKPWQLGEDAEVAHVARGLSMYCGRLQLFQDEEGLYSQTKVEIHSDPSLIGATEERRLKYFEEDGKAFMVLSTKHGINSPEDGMKRKVQLKWEKLE